MFLKFKNQLKKISILSFLVGVLLTAAVGLAAVAFSSREVKVDDNKILKEAIVKPVSAAEIYPEFLCPCCGKPLDPNNICCGSMKQMIDYIDKQAAAGLSYDEIMLAATKEFGINSLAREEKLNEIKQLLAAAAPADAPKIKFLQESLDLGEVSQAGGEIFEYFDFKNEGKGDLVIDKLGSSCGCTAAAIVYQGLEGPRFAMPGHGKENPTGWSVAIAPGDSARVKVYYDPNAHGKQAEARLDITRTISIFSNDPIEFEHELRIDLTQVR